MSFLLNPLYGPRVAKRVTKLALTALISSSFTNNRIIPLSSSFVINNKKPSNINFANHLRTDIRNTMSSTKNDISITSAFDGGNGKLIKTETLNGVTTVHVEIEKDPYTELEQTYHSQYFSFRSFVNTQEAKTIIYVLSNAGNASYPIAWEDSTVFVSSTPSNENSWKRVLYTSYDKETGELSWTHEHDVNQKILYFSYFPPYSYERHLNLIAKCDACPNANVITLGQTLDGREMECVQIGKGEKVCWIIHRQHPGENMAEFYAEGLLERLLGLNHDYAVDGRVKDLLKEYTFYIVPNMNPDGSVRGHLRTNAQGQNLNREWASSTYQKDDKEISYEAPTLERSPEVYHVLTKMDETGCDAFLDVHGDEELPYNFLAGGEGCPNWSTRLKSLHGAFLSKYSKVNSDMQIAVGYEPDEPNQGKLNICSNQICKRFDCLAVTLEMPFKDCASNPDPERGWNPARAKMLGASVLGPLLDVAPFLRGDVTWDEVFCEDERYVAPTSDYKSL